MRRSSHRGPRRSSGARQAADGRCLSVAPLTGWLLRRFNLVKTRRFSQPNLLAGRDLVPEFFQEQVTPRSLGPAVLKQLDRPDAAELNAAFQAIHLELRRNASECAADAILELVQGRSRR
jgi:lipid-A-disaccharide synthase